MQQYAPRHLVFNTLYRTLFATGLTALSTGAIAENITNETFIITATQTKHTTLSAPASVSVVTRAELEKMSVNDVSDAVRKLPGININPSTTYGRKEIKIRGMKSDYTLLLLNGRRINSREARASNMGNDFDLSTIPVSAIDRIEVVRGPMSSLYGADALGGVVNTEGDGGGYNRLSGYLSGPLLDNKLLGGVIVDAGKRNAWRTHQSVNPNSMMRWKPAIRSMH